MNAWLVGALRREVADRRAARGTHAGGQRDAGPYLARMLATGRYPALAAVLAGTVEPDPETAFRAGLDRVLGGLAAGQP